MADDPLRHAFANQLAIVAGFCDLLLSELPESDPLRPRIAEIQQAAHDAIATLSRILPPPARSGW